MYLNMKYTLYVVTFFNRSNRYFMNDTVSNSFRHDSLLTHSMHGNTLKCRTR